MKRFNRTRTLAAFLCVAIALTAMPDSSAAKVRPIAEGGIAAELSGHSTDRESFLNTVSAPLSSALEIAKTAISLNNGTFTPPAPEEHPAVSAIEEKQEFEQNSLYNSLAISQVQNYVNIRKQPDANSEVVGKIYNNAAARIIDQVEASDGIWYQIKSGTVEGFIKASYFVTGEEAEKLATEIGYVNAKINTELLRMRKEPNLDSKTITTLSRGETYRVVEQGDEFTKLSIDDELFGYVKNDYIEVTVTYQEAVSLEEEAAKLAEQERLAKAARDAAKKLEEQKKQQKTTTAEPTTTTAPKTTEAPKPTEPTTTTAPKTTEAPTTEEKTTEAPTTTAPKTTAEPKDGEVSALREAIVATAVQYAGVLPYVWGGDSLETGADCSGFVQQIFLKFNINLPRVSYEQGKSGVGVSSSNMRPGDLVFYSKDGEINHVAIYIGDGQVVHASSSTSVPNTKISAWNYREVAAIRNVIGD